MNSEEQKNFEEYINLLFELWLKEKKNDLSLNKFINSKSD